MKKKLQLCTAGLLLALLPSAGCRKPSTPVTSQPDPSTVIARYKGGEIRRGEIQASIANRLAQVPQPPSQEARQKAVRLVVERRVRTALLLGEAMAKGYAEKPEVRTQQTVAEESLLAEDLLTRETASVTATDAQVAAEVDRRLAAARPEEARKFSHIFLRAPESDADARASAAAQMEKVQKELADGAGFGDLAEKYSESVTARGRGRIDWTLRSSLSPDAAGVIFALKEGEKSGVIRARDGLHLFQLDGIRPGVPVDAAAIRRNVRQELDAEAKAVAVRSRRQQELDARGVEFASASDLERLEKSGTAAGARPVARWKGGEATAAEFLAFRGRVSPTRQPAGIELRLVAENRLLAEARRAQGLNPQIEAEIKDARQQALIDSYRGSLIAELETRPTDEDVSRFHREQGQTALFLRDFEVDILFFPQSGESAAEVYEAGATVGTALRNGVPFDDLLKRPARPDARLCRQLHGADLEAIGRTSIRLRKAILNLGVGDVSAAIYVDGQRTEVVPGTCVLEGKGLVFVRLRSIGTSPCRKAREAIEKALVAEKVSAGVKAIQERLIRESALQILVPEG
ncbi:MAG: peptidylprolyl isomerase [Holophagales bacterium]|nr:peptidylprolyl isomerase [Holophagales bacterium]